MNYITLMKGLDGGDDFSANQVLCYIGFDVVERQILVSEVK